MEVELFIRQRVKTTSGEAWEYIPLDKAIHVCDNCKHSQNGSCPVYPKEVDEKGRVWSDGSGFAGMITCDLQEPIIVYNAFQLARKDFTFNP